MVKHQRRSHQRGVHYSELEDGETSDSDSVGSPFTPQHSGPAQWPQPIHSLPDPRTHSMHRAHSFNDFGQHNLGGYTSSQDYIPRHMAGSGHEYPHIEAGHGDRHSASGVSGQPYYVPEQNHPGVATMHTSVQNYRPAQQVPRTSVPDLGYHGQALTHSVQSSPVSVSSAVVRTPPPQELYYAQGPHQPTAYHTQHSEPPMVQYQHALPVMTQAPSQNTVAQAPVSSQGGGNYASPAEGHWYSHTSYQPPVEVSNPVPAYSSAYDPWQIKIDAYDDPTMQMPSARIESL